MFDKAPEISDLVSSDISAEERAEITTLIKRLRGRWFLKHLRVLQNDHCDADAFRSLMSWLRDPNDALWEEQVLGTWIIGRVSLNAEQKETATHTLCSILRNPPDMRRMRRSSRWARGLVRSIGTMTAVGAGVGLIWLLYAIFTAENGRDWLIPAILVGGICALWLGGIFGCLVGIVCNPLLMPIWLSIDNSHVNRVRRAAAIALGRLRFPESVGALARGAVDRNASVRQASAQALSIVAPLLTSEHYGKLEAEAVPNLCNALVYYEKGSREMDKDIFPNFAKRREELELLEALEKVGDGRAIPTVQWIVQGGTDQDLRATARRILPLLLERERKEKEHQILLRGSEAPAASPEQMLRPATINMTEPPEVLLRPTVQSVDRHAG